MTLAPGFLQGNDELIAVSSIMKSLVGASSRLYTFLKASHGGPIFPLLPP